MQSPGGAAARALPAFLVALERAALVDAARTVGDLAAGGTGVAEIVRDLLAPAQVEVGARWARAQWTVAQEHAATAIIETVLHTAALRAPAPPPSDDAPSLVLCCAEGEWHALAARMAAESLTASGVRVLFLGPSLPAEVLPEFLRADPPTAVGVSCSLSFALPGALRVVRAAHEAGVPVLAAGPGFGTGPDRARAVGADAWVPDVETAVDVLLSWRDAPPPTGPDGPGAAGEWESLQTAGEDTAEPAVQRLLRLRPRLQAFSPALVGRLRKDAVYVLRYAAAAELVDDAALLVDHARWLSDVLAARSVPREVVADLHACLAEELAGRLPRTAALLTAAADAVRAQSSPGGRTAVPATVAP